MIQKPVTVCGNKATLKIGRGLNIAKVNAAETDKPEKVPREIRVRDYRGQKLLEYLIHEMTHLAGWHIDENFIAQHAKDITKVVMSPEIKERIFTAREKRLGNP
jgi:hypothetical protein